MAAGDKISDGYAYTITAPTGGLTKGAIYEGTEVAGVVQDSVTGGDSVSIAFSGVYEVTKKAAATLDFAFGEGVYSLTTGGVNKAVPTGSTILLGYAMEAAATGATTVKVKLWG